MLEPKESARLSIIAVLRNDPNDEDSQGKPYAETVLSQIRFTKRRIGKS
ncbi:MAG TPA: hypothetical protein PKE69_03960 [Pyrinomonadaceae bacterium]|nr:hypothetical protein [Pyrinomonadaceae bacterium]